MSIDKCDVKYQYIDYPRTKALTCRFYKEKEVNENELYKEVPSND